MKVNIYTVKNLQKHLKNIYIIKYQNICRYIYIEFSLLHQKISQSLGVLSTKYLLSLAINTCWLYHAYANRAYCSWKDNAALDILRRGTKNRSGTPTVCRYIWAGISIIGSGGTPMLKPSRFLGTSRRLSASPSPLGSWPLLLTCRGSPAGRTDATFVSRKNLHVSTCSPIKSTKTYNKHSKA